MAEDPLKVIATSEGKKGWVSSKENPRTTAQAKYERLWHLYPLQFDPNRNIMESERIERTLKLIEKHIDIKGKRVADLGCGRGVLSRRLRDLGASVDAVDVAGNAFSRSNSDSIQFSQDYVPRTKLPDDTYDLVIATELIAYLEPSEFRLFMSEMSRIVKPSGLVLCSTPLDINSDDSLYRFHGLSETEFLMDEWLCSYHRYWIRIYDFFAAPGRFIEAKKNADYRKIKLEQREGPTKTWFKINSTSPLVYLWHIVCIVSCPIASWIKKSPSLLLFVEKACKALSSDRGISHGMWIGKRRPLVEETKREDQPKERPGKKEVWE